MTKPLPFDLVIPPQEWQDHGVQGICIGQCIVAASVAGKVRRGAGMTWESDAHAHNRMFLDIYLTEPDPWFGWICTQPPNSKRHAHGVSELGTVSNGILVVPSILGYHEYAHILVPHEIMVGKPGEVRNGHGPRWQTQITELGYPQEAQRYNVRLNAVRGPAFDDGFRPGDHVIVRNTPSIQPKYLRGAEATILKVGRTHLTLEFHDFKTNVTIWHYHCVQHYTDYLLEGAGQQKAASIPTKG